MASTKNRPTGIMIIAVLWTLVSIYNIYQGLNAIILDSVVLPNLSNPNLHEWFRFGVPAEMILGFFVVAYGFLTLLVVYGLWFARPWSYDFGLALPVFILILNVASVMLYLSAPSELQLGVSVRDNIPILVGNLIFLVIIWGYLTQTHVKQYLNKIPTPSPTPVPVPPPPPAPVVTPQEKKFCRYCGKENKTDAVFCERCGKNIG